MILSKTQKYQYSLSGLKNVFLDNIEIYCCAGCEVQIPVIPRILQLHNTIANAIVCKRALLSGAEIRFLRKNLRIKSQDWAKLLRTDKSVYSRWENDLQAVSPQSDLLIRYLYLRLLEERKDIRLEKKIVESLSNMRDEKTAIVIDVEQIEDYSYLSFVKALQLAQVQNLRAVTSNFELFELNESNLFLSEIEKPLPFEKIIGDQFKYSLMTNQELAVAA